jgi:hypothetical protein
MDYTGRGPLQPLVNSPVKASSIVGTTVVNARDESLGDIREIVIDPDTGQVACAVVSFGGLLGMGEKRFAILFSALAWRIGKNDYVLAGYLLGSFLPPPLKAGLEWSLAWPGTGEGAWAALGTSGATFGAASGVGAPPVVEGLTVSPHPAADRMATAQAAAKGLAILIGYLPWPCGRRLRPGIS